MTLHDLLHANFPFERLDGLVCRPSPMGSKPHTLRVIDGILYLGYVEPRCIVCFEAEWDTDSIDWYGLNRVHVDIDVFDILGV